MADSAGKTTTGLYACMQALLERGETALFVSASPEDSAALYKDFEGCRATGIWGWSIRAVQGRHGIVAAEQKRRVTLTPQELDATWHQGATTSSNTASRRRRKNAAAQNQGP